MTDDFARSGPPPGNETDEPVTLLYIADSGLTTGPDLRAVTVAGKILVGASDGRPLQTLATGQFGPDGIDVLRTTATDDGEGHESSSNATTRVFWTSMGIPPQNDGAVLSCLVGSSSMNDDENTVLSIVPRGAVHTPKQLCVDPVDRKLYFADREGMRVMRCGLDGTDLETLVRTGNWTETGDKRDQRRWCVGVAVSRKLGRLFWTQKGPGRGGQGRIFQAGLEIPEGQTAETRDDVECLVRGLPEPIDLDVDEEGEMLYWSDRGELPLGNSINRTSLRDRKPVEDMDGGGMEMAWPGKDYEMVARNLHEAIGVKLDLRHRRIFATDMGGCVYMMDLDGMNKKKLYETDDRTFMGISLAYP